MKNAKRQFIAAFVAASSLQSLPSAVSAQYPFELDADRLPKTITNKNCLIVGARILTATKGALDNADILVTNGKIAAIGQGLRAPRTHVTIQAKGLVVAPGIVDAHSHRASDGTNEGAESITAEVRIRDVLNVNALTSWQALASGHTSALILHGSANCVGGESQVIKYKFGRTNDEAVFSDAPRMIKFALGENVTRKSSTTRDRFPATRMGQEAVYRRAFTEARAYMHKWDDFKAGKSKDRPRKDLRLETLSDILRKKVWVQCHSYRSDEMLMMAKLSKEFGFKIGALQHALEAYKIAPELASLGVGVSIFVDSWSFKQEGYDSIPWNAAICKKAGVNVSINTDGVSGTTALNMDAAKTMRFGGFSEQEALQTITINPARQLGIDHRVGSIEVGKDADFGVWDGSPMSPYAKCVMTMIEGEIFFERKDAFGVDSKSPHKLTLDPMKNLGEAKPLRKSNSYAITGATVHTVSNGDIQDGSVLIQNGKITAVGKNLSIPSGTVTVSGKGMHVYPGFIDANSSIGLLEIGPIPVMNDNAEFGVFQPDMDAATALWVESAHWGPARYNGVTNCFAAPSGGSIPGQGVLANTDGYTTDQMTVKRKAALVVNLAGGGGGLPDFDLCCDNVDMSMLLGLGGDDSIRQFTLPQLDQYYELMSHGGPQEAPVSTGDANINRYFDRAIEYMNKRKVDASTPVDLQLEAMIPYLKGESVVALLARRSAQIRSAVAFSKKYKLKSVIIGGNEAWRETAILKESGIPVVLNPAGLSELSANTTDNAWDPYDTPYVRPYLLARAGVKFAFGQGSGQDVMNLAVQVGESCAYGLSKEDAIRALTLSAAEAFGVDDKLGSISEGKIANLVVVDGDPFEMTSSYRYVFVNGQPASMENKHTRLRDRYLARVGGKF
jgi:imidazolonepropionase-like amidohydrolase